MATTVTKVIDPDMGTGYDYDSLYDWEVAQQGDLTGARDEIAVAKCRCTAGTADTTGANGVSIDGWTTSATQYVKVIADTGHAAGPVWSNSIYRISMNPNSVIFFPYEAYTQIVGLQIERSSSPSDNYNVVTSYGPNITFIGCHIRTSTGSTYYESALFFNDTSAGKQCAINCILHNRSSTDASSSMGIALRRGNCYIYNCTVIGGKYGIKILSDSGFHLKNCYVGNSITEDYNGTFSTKLTCASEDSSGSSGLTGINYSVSAGAYFTNVTAGSEDFSIESLSELIGAGTNLYDDTNYAFQTDIDGDDRGGSGASWDIGADEYTIITRTKTPVIDSILYKYLTGSVCWGHITGVTQNNIRPITPNWSGTGAIENSGDSERMALEGGEYLDSEIVEISGSVRAKLNSYVSGDAATIRYKTAAVAANVDAESWTTITDSTPFASSGFVKLRIEAPA